MFACVGSCWLLDHSARLSILLRCLIYTLVVATAQPGLSVSSVANGAGGSLAVVFLAAMLCFVVVTAVFLAAMLLAFLLGAVGYLQCLVVMTPTCLTTMLHV